MFESDEDEPAEERFERMAKTTEELWEKALSGDEESSETD